MPDQPNPAPPSLIEGFVIGARIRESGALAVHAGRSRLDLPVEVYLVREAALTGGFEADDFLAGVRRAAAVHHEALLPFVTGGRQDGCVYAVAKSADGRTMEDVVAKDGPLAEAKALAFATTTLGALAALERAGMRHGDLSPRRVIFAGTDLVVAGPPRLLPASVSPRDDRWQAPEEARGGENGVQSDFFVLGLMLFFALTGAHPLADAPDARRALRDWKTPDLASTLRRASPVTRAFIARLLAAEPTNRFASAADAARAAAEAASGDHPETAPIGVAVAAAAPAPAPIDAPAPRPAPDAAKRTPGRLYVAARLGESMLEIDDDVVFVGPAGAQSVRAQTEPFPEATIRVERSPAGDVAHAVAGEMKVNGTATAKQLLADGDRVEASGVTARYERAARAVLRSTRSAAPEAAPSNPLATALVVIAIIVTMVALGWGALRWTKATTATGDAKSLAARAEQTLTEDKRRLGAAAAPAPAPTASTAAQAERAARDDYLAAAQAVRRRPADALAKYRDVWRRHPDTAYGLLARLDALDLERRVRPAPDRTLEELLAAVEGANGGSDDDALGKLRTYAEDHAGTLAGERAHLALVKTMAVQRGRFDADMTSLRAAIARKDWREALTIMKPMFDYAPSNLRDELRVEQRRIEAALSEAYKESGGGAPTKPDDGKPKDAPPAKNDGAEKNRKAEELFRTARKAMEEGKEIDALDAFLVFLHEFKDTPNGTKYDPDARRMVATLTSGSAGIVRLFRGKVEKAEKGRVRITYDFEDANQIEDFRDVAAFEAPPRAVWKIDGGGVKCSKGSGALVLDAVFAADQVTTSVVVSPDRPHDLGVTFMDPTEQRRFYLFTLQNTFFTLGKGDAAKPFLENAIVLFGPNMWRDTPPNQLGFVRKCGADEPLVRTSEPQRITAEKSGGEVGMKFEGGRSIKGSAYGDTKYEFPGVMPGVFVIGSAGWFDNFVVEGTIDQDWVQKRWRVILSGL
jgi:serine/threonine-protein kinase